MASNNYLNANVTPSSDTFREWIDLTNRITYDMEKVVVSTVANTQGACTSGNAYVNGFFSANTLLVENELKGVSANSTIYGTVAAAANLSISTNSVFVNSYAYVTSNSTINNFVVGQLTATQNSTSNNIAISSSLNQFQSNAIVNDFNSNVDIDNALTDITSTNLAITGTETNIDANAVFTANVNITSDALDFNIGADEVIINTGTTLFSSNAATNRFNTIIDANANVDIDNALTDITSTNLAITGTETNIDANTVFTANVNIHSDTADFNIGADEVVINSSATSFTSNAATNIFNTIIDANANVDIDNALTDITSTTTNISGTTATIDSTTTNIHGTNLDVNSNTVIDGDLTINANTVLGSNNSDIANVQALIVSSIEPSANGKVLGHADRRWAAALTTANTSGDITAGADVDITGEVNAATAAIVGLATIGGNVTVSGDIDGANNKEANVYNAVVRNDLTVSTNTVLNGNVTINSAKDFILGNSSYKAIQSNVSSNVKSIVIGSVSDSNNRIVVHSAVGNSTVGLMPLHGNNIALGNTTNRWVASFATANTSGAFTSTGDITGGADIDITGEANTATLRVRTTTNMGGKLTIASDGAAITGPVDLVNSINVGANVGMTTAHMLVKGTAAVGNTIANSSVLHVGNSTVNTHISKGGIDTDGTLAVLKAATFSNTVTAADDVDISGEVNAASAAIVGSATVGADLTVSGNTVIGSAAADTVNVTAQVVSSIEPSASGKVLGHASRRWAAALTTANTSGDITAGGDVDITGEVNAASGAIVGDLSVGDDITLANTSNVIFSNTGISANATALTSNNLVVDHLQVGVAATLPDDTTLTASTLGSANLTITNATKLTGAATAGTGNNVLQIGNGANTVTIDFANAAANGHLLAKTTNSYDIGSAAKSFRSGYFDTSVVVGDTVANTTAVVSDFIYAKQDLVANYSSDQQLKDNVLKIDTALDKVNSLGGYSFTWNNNIGDMRAGTPDYGVIAQEIENVLPHAVDINSRGHKTVNYNSLIPLLIEAVKELTERVKELEPDVEEPEVEEDVDG
jgi:hypothetical protein